MLIYAATQPQPGTEDQTGCRKYKKSDVPRYGEGAHRLHEVEAPGLLDEIRTNPGKKFDHPDITGRTCRMPERSAPASDGALAEFDKIFQGETVEA